MIVLFSHKGSGVRSL